MRFINGICDDLPVLFAGIIVAGLIGDNIKIGCSLIAFSNTKNMPDLHIQYDRCLFNQS